MVLFGKGILVLSIRSIIFKAFRAFNEKKQGGIRQTIFK